MAMDRTKSELESENESLWRAIGKLRDKMDKLQVENRILRGRLQASTDDLSIEEYQAQIMVAKRQKGSKTNKEKAEARVAAFLEEYDAARDVGMSPEDARDKANELLPTYSHKGENFDKYRDEKDGRPNRRLRDLLKMHRPDDWP
jgi:hypothetical protein